MGVQLRRACTTQEEANVDLRSSLTSEVLPKVVGALPPKQTHR